MSPFEADWPCSSPGSGIPFGSIQRGDAPRCSCMMGRSRRGKKRAPLQYDEDIGGDPPQSFKRLMALKESLTRKGRNAAQTTNEHLIRYQPERILASRKKTREEQRAFKELTDTRRRRKSPKDAVNAAQTDSQRTDQQKKEEKQQLEKEQEESLADVRADHVLWAADFVPFGEVVSEPPKFQAFPKLQRKIGGGENPEREGIIRQYRSLKASGKIKKGLSDFTVG